MSKRKSFGISSSVSQGLSEAISIVENNDSIFRAIRIPLSRLEKDPDNPRKLDITPDDIIHGLDRLDPKFEIKQHQLEDIKELAFSIENTGLINPISVYKHLEKYRIIAGERRYLAALLSKKTEIDARVLQQKPSRFDLKLLQWFENTNREDLSAFERLENVREILMAKEGSDSLSEVSGILIETITGMSRSQAAVYASIIAGPIDVYEAIKMGEISNLKIATLLIKCKDASKRKLAIEKCKGGVSLEKAKEIIAAIEKPASHKETTGPVGRKKTKVTLGSTKNTLIVQTIIDAVTALPKFKHYSKEFTHVNWDDIHNATHAFVKLIEMMEAEI